MQITSEIVRLICRNFAEIFNVFLSRSLFILIEFIYII